MKSIFHLPESIGSARIEGNNTTVAEYIETKLESTSTTSESFKEIKNIENAMSFIEEHIASNSIDRLFVSEIHKKVVDGLSEIKEGDSSPGEYVLGGLKREIEKIDNLLNYPYLKKEILIPAISHSVERKYLTAFESQVLQIAAKKQVIQASDLKTLLPGKSPTEISREIRKLIDKKKLLTPVTKNARKYVICFEHSYLFRSIMWALGEKGFLPNNDAEEM